MGSVDTWVSFWGRRGPDRLALASGTRVVSWGALAGRSARLAAGLAGAGAVLGSRVGVVARDPIDVVEVIAACAQAGAIAVLLDDPGMAERAGLFALVTDPDELLGDELPGGASEIGMDEPLLMLRPGAAMLTHGNVEAVAVAAIAADGLVPPDCVGVAAGSVTAMAAVLGGLHAGVLTRFGGEEGLPGLLGDTDLPRPTVLVTTGDELGRPGIIERLAAAGAPRLVKVPGPMTTALRGRCDPFGILVVEMYGVAGGGGLSLQQPPSGGGLVPVLGQQARVAGAAGQPGELMVAGSAVAACAGGWLRTGDLAVAGPDGSLTILGRCT